LRRERREIACRAHLLVDARSPNEHSNEFLKALPQYQQKITALHKVGAKNIGRFPLRR